MSELVLTERDSVAVVTLNRPDALNALSDALMAELVETLQELDRDEEVRCIVLAGNDKAFAAGADIAELARSSAIETGEASDFVSTAKSVQKIASVWRPPASAARTSASMSREAGSGEDMRAF